MEDREQRNTGKERFKLMQQVKALISKVKLVFKKGKFCACMKFKEKEAMAE